MNFFSHFNSFSLITANAVRMRNAHILLVTIRALANEVAKNLVLAGIGSLTVLDPDTVAEDDLGGQFFIGEEHVGMNVCLGLPCRQSFD